MQFVYLFTQQAKSLIDLDEKEVKSLNNVEDIMRNIFSNVNLHNSMYDRNNEFEYNAKESSLENQNYFMRDITKKFNKPRLYAYEHYFFWFKDYFEKFLETENALINENGYIPRTWQYYIAIMAASSAKSLYLFKSLEEKFLEAGGDESWLIYGLDVVPEKLKKLARFNNVFSHQPWKIKGDDLKVLFFISI